MMFTMSCKKIQKTGCNCSEKGQENENKTNNDGDKIDNKLGKRKW